MGHHLRPLLKNCKSRWCNYGHAKANRSRCALQGNASFPWIEAWCTEYGCAYYFNTKTGEAEWILESPRGTLTPTGMHLRDSEGRWPTNEPSQINRSTKEAKHAAFERTSAADDSNASFSSDSAEKPDELSGGEGTYSCLGRCPGKRLKTSETNRTQTSLLL